MIAEDDTACPCPWLMSYRRQDRGPLDRHRPSRIGDSITLAVDDVYWSIEFTPIGGYLVGVGKDSGLRICDLNEQCGRPVCRATHGLMTPDVWPRHLPHRPPCD
ncbi:hypothetical protein [Nocardia sp. CA-119907]|uniref:hypothetical protein n=1 Tax=Nocardia sp. CA-119907 TaxID=3239973 RepID=UPI003D963695